MDERRHLGQMCSAEPAGTPSEARLCVLEPRLSVRVGWRDFLERPGSNAPRVGRQAAMMDVQGSMAPHMMMLTLVPLRGLAKQRETGEKGEGLVLGVGLGLGAFHT